MKCIRGGLSWGAKLSMFPLFFKTWITLKKLRFGLLKYCFGPKNLAKADQFNGWIRSAHWKSGFGSTKHPPGLNCITALASLKGFYFSDSVLTLVGFNF